MLRACRWIHHASLIGRRQNLQEYKVREEWAVEIKIELIGALGIWVRIDLEIDREITGQTRISIISGITQTIMVGIFI